MPAAEVRPAGASQYSTGGVCFLRSRPMSVPVWYLANWCSAAFLSASFCSRTAMKPTPPHAVWSPLAFGKFAMSQFFPNSQFLSAFSTLIIALGRWRIAMSPLRNRACEDRKSTRLNSSHSQISYAVFCLKKKIDLRVAVAADLDCDPHSVRPALRRPSRPVVRRPRLPAVPVTGVVVGEFIFANAHYAVFV